MNKYEIIKKRILILFILFLLISLVGTVTYPHITKYVNDNANIIDIEYKQKISELTDVQIGDNIITPNFKNGEYGKGIQESMFIVERLFTNNIEVVSKYLDSNDSDISSWLIILIILIIIIVILVLFYNSRRKGGGRRGSSSGRGESGDEGFGGGSSGGGGFGGRW